MATTKYQGFPTYRYAQIALKGNHKLDTSQHRIDLDAEENSEQVMHDDVRQDDNEDEVNRDEYQDEKEEFEVDYEHEVTDLYQAITNSQWDSALETLKTKPQQARTWVVRYREDRNKGVMWKFLPIHSACARQPPQSIIASLIKAYPEAAGSCDDQGMVSFLTTLFY